MRVSKGLSRSTLWLTKGKRYHRYLYPERGFNVVSHQTVSPEVMENGTHGLSDWDALIAIQQISNSVGFLELGAHRTLFQVPGNTLLLSVLVAAF
jgi:hypothetical protein